MTSRTLITGMSGTGKSSVVSELKAQGYFAIDADAPGWSSLKEFNPTRSDLDWNWDEKSEFDWVWDETKVRDFLDYPPAEFIFLSGTSPTQGKFREQFEHIILLSAPTPLIVERLRTRTTYDYGKLPNELEDVLTNIAQIEPLLRTTATLEIDTAQPLAQVVAEILDHVGL